MDSQRLTHLWEDWKNVCKGDTTTAERYMDGQGDLRQPEIKIYGRWLVFQMANPQSISGG